MVSSCLCCPVFTLPGHSGQRPTQVTWASACSLCHPLRSGSRFLTERTWLPLCPTPRVTCRASNINFMGVNQKTGPQFAHQRFQQQLRQKCSSLCTKEAKCSVFSGCFRHKPWKASAPKGTHLHQWSLCSPSGTLFINHVPRHSCVGHGIVTGLPWKPYCVLTLSCHLIHHL